MPSPRLGGASPNISGAAASLVTTSKKAFKRQPLRSAIACLRCRKSKIKCDNDGPTRPCDACLKAGKECRYPEFVALPAKRVDPPTTSLKSDVAGSDRKRLKRTEDGLPQMNDGLAAVQYAEEVLSASFLTETLWCQILDLYRLHFSTELPFLHLATMKEKVSSKFRAKQQCEESSPDVNLVLLGLLTLTARYHADLVKYVTHSTAAVNKTSAASEYYADALTCALGPVGLALGTASVEKVQAFLMLGLYEWTQARPQTGGVGAWMYVGNAIRMAQALGLGFGDKPYRANGYRSRTTRKGRSGADQAVTVLPSQVMIAKEIRRRTMFSCLVLDRMLACGQERVHTIRSEDLQIQLPCSEVAFDLSEDVHTGFLKPTPQDREVLARTRVNNDSVLARFVQLVDLWGEISKYSFTGGRFADGDMPPWSEQSTFYRLRHELDAFYHGLPEVFTLNTSNYHKHENHQASSVYVSLHMLGSVGQIMLHREYIPFIAILCPRPTGPLDEPTFASEPYDGFWVESAEHIFRAAKDIVDLIDICRDKLPMSNLALFATWTAAFVGIYAEHFPHMDTEGHMLASGNKVVSSHDADEMEDRGGGGGGECRFGPVPEADLTEGTGPTAMTFRTLTRMSEYMKTASTYATYFKDMDRYYRRIRQCYFIHHTDHAQSATPGGDGKITTNTSLGGGLEMWKRHGLKVVNNGILLAEAPPRHGGHDSVSDVSRASTVEREGCDGTVSSDDHHPRRTSLTPAQTPSFGFKAINHNTVSPVLRNGASDGAPHSSGPGTLTAETSLHPRTSSLSLPLTSSRMSHTSRARAGERVASRDGPSAGGSNEFGRGWHGRPYDVVEHEPTTPSLSQQPRQQHQTPNDFQPPPRPSHETRAGGFFAPPLRPPSASTAAAVPAQLSPSSSTSAYTTLSPHMAEQQVPPLPPPPSIPLAPSHSQAPVHETAHISATGLENVLDHIADTQSMPWFQALGGIDFLAHGIETDLSWSGMDGEVFWDQGFEATLNQMIGTFR